MTRPATPTRSGRRTTTGLRRKRNRRVTQRALLPSVAVPRALAQLVVGAGLLTGLVLAGSYGWAALVESARLRVSSVEVLGSGRARWDDLQAYTDLHVGDAILGLDLDTIAAGVRRHPWIKSATVRRRLPDRVTIDVVEHQPAVAVALGEIYLANEEGEIFKRLEIGDGVVLPVVTGLGRNDPITRGPKTREVLREAAALQAALLAPATAAMVGELQELHWDWDLGWSVVVTVPPQPTDPRSARRPLVTAHLGKDPVSRIDILAATLVRLETLGRVPAEVWVDGTQTPHRVHVRLAHATTISQPISIAKAGD